MAPYRAVVADESGIASEFEVVSDDPDNASLQALTEGYRLTGKPVKVKKLIKVDY